ncbi:MAG: hypothetical protein WDW38_001284 [Sanguina aurantia]
MSFIHTSAEDALLDKYAARDRKEQVNQEAIKAKAVAAAIEASAAAAVIRAAAQNIKAVAEQKERERDQMQRQRSGPPDSAPPETAGGTAKERAVQALMAQQRTAQPAAKTSHLPAPKRPSVRQHTAGSHHHQPSDEGAHPNGNPGGYHAVATPAYTPGVSVARTTAVTTSYAAPSGQYGLSALLSARPQQQVPPQAQVIPQQQQQQQWLAQHQQQPGVGTASQQVPAGAKRPAEPVVAARRYDDDDDDEDDDYYD